MAIKSSSRLANLLPRPSVQWLQRACAELAAVHSDEGSGVKQCGVCKRMVFSYLLSNGQHKVQCIPADAPPSTGEDPRRRKARTASRQPSPVSPRPSARHVSPPSKRQKPAAVRPAQPTAKASHLNASFANRKLPQEAAAAPPRSHPPNPVPHPSTLSRKAAQCRRRRTKRNPRSKPFVFVPFDPSDFTPAWQHQGIEPDAPQGGVQGVGPVEPHSRSKPRSAHEAGQQSLEMRPASSATSQPVSPSARNPLKRHISDGRTSQGAGRGGGDPCMPEQQHKHPGVSAAPQTGCMQPSVTPHNAMHWAQHSQQQVQQLPMMQTHPLYANTGAGSTMVRMGHGESSGCSQQHLQMHAHLQGGQQQQVPNHTHAGGYTMQQATQRKNPLPISHAELAKLFQNYLKSKKITRTEFSQEHREAFKQMVLRLSAQRLPSADNAAEQQQQQHHHTQHPQQQQQAHPQVQQHQHHLQHQQPQQQLHYAVAMNHQSALGRGVQMHLQHSQASRVPSAVDQSPTHSLHTLSGGRVPSCGQVDGAMHAGAHMHSGMQMHMNAAGRGLQSAGNYIGSNMGNVNVNAASRLGSPHTQQLAATHAGHAPVAHGVNGHMHLQQQAMYPLGMQGHLLGHGEALNRMGGLAVQTHHHDARWWTGT